MISLTAETCSQLFAGARWGAGDPHLGIRHMAVLAELGASGEVSVLLVVHSGRMSWSTGYRFFASSLWLPPSGHHNPDCEANLCTWIDLKC